MLEPFQRLSQNFTPIDNVQGVDLPASSRQLKTWIEDLPRGNPKETAAILYSALVKSLSEKLSGATRFQQLDEVRQVTVDSITWLERQFVGASLPLINERFSFAHTALNLHNALADGYRLAAYEICSPNGTIPMLKGAVAYAALERSLWHYQQSLIISWKLYRSSVKNVWLGIHRIYQFAKQMNLETKVVEDKLLTHATTIHDLYCQTALVSLMNPYAFTQAEQVHLIKLAELFASQSRIGVNKLTEQWIKLPIDSDHPVDSNLPDDQVMYFCFQHLSIAVNEVDDNCNADTLKLDGIGDQHITVPTSLLLKVKRSLGFAMARRFTREFACYPIESVVGLNTIHYFAAGRLDFDHFIQQLPRIHAEGLNASTDWHSKSSDATVQRAIVAEVLDHSLAGYRIKWENDTLLRLRVGEILGLNVMHPEPDWMIGVIRWLQYEDNGSVVAGIELLTRRCQAVAIRMDQNVQSSLVSRGLELEPLEEQLPVQFIVSGRQEVQIQKVDVYFGYEPNRIGAARIATSFETQATKVVSNMDYSLLIAQLPSG
ncbi:MAG: hypothetical protein KA902_05910 [Arenimonas sp.]|nr:hypothetical protein [Arenimonas sp.]